MKQFTIYNAEGQILRTGSAPESMLEIQVRENEFLLDGSFDDNAYYIDINEGIPVKIPEQPDKFHKFDYSTKTWIDPRSIQDIRNLQWETIKTERDRTEFGTFEYNGMIFDGDVNAQRRLNTYISISKSALLNNQPFSAQFILANNSVVELTSEDFVNIELAKANSVAAAFVKGTQLRQIIEAAHTKEEIKAVVW